MSPIRRLRLARAAAYGLVALSLGLSATAAAAAPFRIIITETETPLVPNSVLDLANQLGFYKQAGVDVELVRVQQTPSAVAALRSGQGDMANISVDTALHLVARDQMKLKGVFSADKALPFVIVAKKEYASPKQLEGRIFGVARIGSVDYLLSRTVLGKLGASPDKLQYLAVGQPAVRAQSLLASRIDATAISIGVWTTLADTSALNVVVDQTSFYKAAPFVTKLNVVTEEVAKTRSKEVQSVVRAIVMASREFAKDPTIWIEAMVKARPDVKRASLEALAENYRKSWSVNGGLNLPDLAFTTDMLYEDAEWKELKRVAPKDWIDTRFVDAVLAESGTTHGSDPAGR
jgi:NitT/TauT family transport system substrate-binding protein